ncbi:sulfotransferase family cytosolic 1B member 1-like [Anneissia japonica]|uniref:sulfotransferase family cytosolic 1B member 1-like n=1 Tax=Anneissia japonica TaxID=1529436 RepID=UPI001425502F|nr:sulfotransferase family cytosolic 1B member 1-like [Anneissia japonica]
MTCMTDVIFHDQHCRSPTVWRWCEINMAGKMFSGEEFEKGYYHYKEVKFHRMIIPPANLDAMATFEVRPDDIFLITYPKCGTHWSAEIINLILTAGDPDKIDHTRQEAAIEMSYLKDKSNPTSFVAFHLKLASMEGRRVILTHLPEHLLPPQVFSKKPKVIYVTRNPKDCGVSFYHAMSGLMASDWNGHADKWIKQDDLIGGGFFTHVLSYWKHRHEPNFLYMKYEDMKKDPRGSIIRFADHLECPLSDEEIDLVVHHSEVKNMKKTYDKVEKKTPDGKFLTKAMGKSPFIRKGQIGDWKNHFTVAENEAFDAVIHQNLSGTGLTFDYE